MPEVEKASANRIDTFREFNLPSDRLLRQMTDRDIYTGQPVYMEHFRQLLERLEKSS